MRFTLTCSKCGSIIYSEDYHESMENSAHGYSSKVPSIEEVIIQAGKKLGGVYNNRAEKWESFPHYPHPKCGEELIIDIRKSIEALKVSGLNNPEV